MHAPNASLQPELDAPWQPAEYQEPAAAAAAAAAASPVSSPGPSDESPGLPRKPTFVQQVPVSPDEVEFCCLAADLVLFCRVQTLSQQQDLALGSPALWITDASCVLQCQPTDVGCVKSAFLGKPTGPSYLHQNFCRA